MEIILKDIYKEIKTIAVFGSSPKEDRPVYSISKALQKRGYKLFPINPNYEMILGEPVFKDIRDIEASIDLALFFVNSEKAYDLIKKSVEKGVKYIWLQEGVISVVGEEYAENNGVPFMMNKCIYKELKKIEEDM